MVVYDDYILVAFHYKEGADLITFGQIERSDISLCGSKVNFAPAFILDSAYICDLSPLWLLFLGEHNFHIVVRNFLRFLLGKIHLVQNSKIGIIGFLR